MNKINLFLYTTNDYLLTKVIINYTTSLLLADWYKDKKSSSSKQKWFSFSFSESYRQELEQELEQVFWLSARTLATNHFNRNPQALSKNVFIRADITLSALETFLFSGLYMFTLLTYLLIG